MSLKKIVQNKKVVSTSACKMYGNVRLRENCFLTGYVNPTGNITDDKELNAFATNSGARKGCTVISLEFNIVLKVLIIVIKQEKK